VTESRPPDKPVGFREGCGLSLGACEGQGPLRPPRSHVQGTGSMEDRRPDGQRWTVSSVGVEPPRMGQPGSGQLQHIKVEFEFGRHFSQLVSPVPFLFPTLGAALRRAGRPASSLGLLASPQCRTPNRGSAHSYISSDALYPAAASACGTVAREDTGLGWTLNLCQPIERNIM
jgi:hypothetical protein